MPHNRALTEQRLLDAVAKIVAEEGMDHVRINRVAVQAGVNKILIYRYFGGIEGLRNAYLSQSKPIITLPPLNIEALRNRPLDVIFETFCDYTLEEYRLLRQNPQAMAVLRASLLNGDDLSNALTRTKTHDFQTLVDGLAEMVGTRYGRSFSALIHSALTLLALQSQQKRVAFGFDLSAETAWEDIEITLRHLFRGAYLYTKERIEQESPAL